MLHGLKPLAARRTVDPPDRGNVANSSDPTIGLPDLEGRWLRLGSDKGAQRYPIEITFRVGTYLGKRAEQQGMILWDAGTYRLVDSHTLIMSTASDELVTYPVVLRGGLLKVGTTEGEVVFERATPQP
jgi:hypothetical protein